MNETRTSFVNRIMELSLGSTQGKFSYCNDETRRILFSLNLSHGADSNLILSPKWARRGVSHSLKHLEKILKHNYELYVFETKTRKNSRGQTIADGFSPIIEKRCLFFDGFEYFALPFDRIEQNSEEQFREDVSKSARDSSEARQKRLKAAHPKPPIKTVSTVVFVRNPDVVAEVLYRANGVCELCKSNAPFVRASDGSPYLEVHHRKPLSKGGDDTVENAIALCPNCHRKAHFG